MQQYLAIIEKAAKNYSAFLPDVPGCIATGNTLDETLVRLQEALEFHFEGMAEEDLELPIVHSLQYHVKEGTFNEDEISTDYLIAMISVPEHKAAA